jgi:hypothetical protein
LQWHCRCFVPQFGTPLVYFRHDSPRFYRFATFKFKTNGIQSFTIFPEFMWPFSNNAYLSIVDAQRAERERAISTAAPSVASEHSVYLNATGGSFDAFTLLGKLMYF